MNLTCLHTAESNIPIYENARPMGVFLDHVVHPELIEEANRVGHASVNVLGKTKEIIAGINDTEGLLITCTTIGDVASQVIKPFPVMRADEALAHRAAKLPGSTDVLITSPTTLNTTQRLFSKAAIPGRPMPVLVVENAWNLFMAGDNFEYFRAIRNAIDKSRAKNLVLAQSSMAPVAKDYERNILTVPYEALNALMLRVNENNKQH